MSDFRDGVKAEADRRYRDLSMTKLTFKEGAMWAFEQFHLERAQMLKLARRRASQMQRLIGWIRRLRAPVFKRVS